MGRPRKPTKLQIIKGKFESHPEVLRERQNEMELQASPVGQPPAYLSPEAAAEWSKLATDPVYRQVLTPMFAPILTEYCALVGQMQRAMAGRVAWIGGQPSETVLERWPKADSDTLRSLSMQLGLSPASQGKVQMPKADAPKNKWANLG